MSHIAKIVILTVFALTFCLTSNTRAQTAGKISEAAASSTLTKGSADVKRRLETFDLVWSTIEENYFERTFNGLDWQKVRQEYRPRAAAAKTDPELHRILQEMILRLGRSHFVIIPPEVLSAIDSARRRSAEASRELSEEDEDTSASDNENESEDTDPEEEENGKYGLGIELRMFGNDLVITRIEQGSSAERAGLRPGFVLKKVNDIDLLEFFGTIEQTGKKTGVFEKKLPIQVVEWFLNGEKGSLVALELLDEKGERKSLTLERDSLAGEFVTVLKNVPELYMQFESRSLSEEIGYVRFNYFALPVIEKFCNAVREHQEKKALIIDLRGNRGGLVGTVMGIASFLTDRPISIGTEISRTSKDVRQISPHAKRYAGNIYLLIDELSFSAAEIFAAALQENELATVYGVKSAGEALPSLTLTLPTGAVFLFPVADFRTPRGNSLEGRGVMPDVRVSLDRNNLSKGIDDQFEKVLEVVRKDLTEPKKTRTTGKSVADRKSPPNGAITIVDMNATKRSSTVRIQQRKALELFERHLRVIGGRERLETIENFEATGKVELRRSGAVVEGELEIFWIRPDRYMENYFIEGAGKISDVVDGPKYYVESEFTGSDEITRPDVLEDRTLSMGFFELLNIGERYNKIIYSQAYIEDGIELDLVEASTESGLKTFFAFDKRTGLLYKRVSSASGEMVYSDYRDIGDGIKFPMTINKGTSFKYVLDKLNINTEMPENLFQRKQSCFDETPGGN